MSRRSSSSSSSTATATTTTSAGMSNNFLSPHSKYGRNGSSSFSIGSATDGSTRDAGENSRKVALDDEKVIQFFNDLELKEDHSDLALLLEAEKRGLLNPVCEHILTEARRRGWVSPKKGTQGRLEAYQVKYLGASTIPNINETAQISHRDIADAIKRISKNPRMAFQTLLLLEVHEDCLRLFDVNSTSQDTMGRKTLKKLKNMTLRKIMGRKSSMSQEDISTLPVEDGELIAQHDRSNIVRFVSFDRIVAVIVKEVDFTDRLTFTCHAYRCKTQSKAFEVADHLRVTHEGILQTHEAQRRKRFPKERVTLSCASANGSYGINLIGQTTRVEASTGVFILSIDKGSVADRHPTLKRGLQILAVNGISTEEVTTAECREQIRASKSSVVLDVQENPFGFGLHEYNQGIHRPSVSYASSHDVNNAADDDDDDEEDNGDAESSGTRAKKVKKRATHLADVDARGQGTSNVDGVMLFSGTSSVNETAIDGITLNHNAHDVSAVDGLMLHTSSDSGHTSTTVDTFSSPKSRSGKADSSSSTSTTSSRNSSQVLVTVSDADRATGTAKPSHDADYDEDAQSDVMMRTRLASNATKKHGASAHTGVTNENVNTQQQQQRLSREVDSVTQDLMNLSRDASFTKLSSINSSRW